MENVVEDYLVIGKEKYPVKKCEIEQSKLKFYPENPRVYSVLNINNYVPTQKEIEELMCKKDHVKRLKESIKSNGGLIDPIIVRDGDFVVLEGNSRLAAYRMLSAQDPIKWSKIKAMILPKDIPDSAVFALIGQYHIIGRKDWEPYEQAGYLSRTLSKSNQTLELLASNLGISVSDIKKLFSVYEYMIEKNDNHPSKWSYYEELLKNRGIKKAFNEIPELEDKIIDDIKNDRIKMAIDIRKLGDISKVNDKLSKKILKEIANGEEDIYSGFDIVASSGKMDNNYQMISNFRKKITDESFGKRLLNDDNLKDIEFELKKIERTVSVLLKNIERRKDE